MADSAQQQHDDPGAPQSPPQAAWHSGGATWAAGPRLRRPHQGRMIGGVAAGLAEYFAVDVAVVRVALVVLTLLGGVGIPAYLAAWLLVPDECEDQSVVEDWMARHGHAA